MLKDSRGYIFESRVDDYGNKGFKETFDIFNHTATVLVALDAVFHIVPPRFYTREEGYKLLEREYKTEEELELFKRSKRATYAVVENFSYMARVRVDVDTKQIKGVEFFTPIVDTTMEVYKGYASGRELPVFTDDNGNQRHGYIKKKPCTVFYKIDTRRGNGKQYVSDETMFKIMSSFKEGLENIDFTSKTKFLMSRFVGDSK